MDPKSTLHDMQAWPLDQQADFILQAWENLADQGWQPEITEEFAAELDRRLAALDANPDSLLTWDEVKARLRQDP